jgi:hypothetical protein
MTLEECRKEVEGWLQIKLVTGRCSNLLMDELAAHMQGRTLNVFVVYDEIGGLEGAPLTRPRSTKPATAFRGPVLGGLWHKHYSTPAFIGRNLLNHWTPARLAVLTKEVAEDDSVPANRKESLLSYRMVMEGHQERHRQGRVTGEWIVYARGTAANTYLTLASHTEEDDAIRARVDQAAREFPGLQL